MNLPKIEWRKIAEDDFIFEFEGYRLLVEKAKKREYWMNVCLNYDHLDFDITQTELEAKLSAEVAFIRHYVNNNRMELE